MQEKGCAGQGEEPSTSSKQEGRQSHAGDACGVPNSGVKGGPGWQRSQKMGAKAARPQIRSLGPATQQRGHGDSPQGDPEPTG